MSDLHIAPKLPRKICYFLVEVRQLSCYLFEKDNLLTQAKELPCINLV